MKVAITGAGGFVGGYLTRRLASDGHRVVALLRGAAEGRNGAVPNVDYVGGVDVTDPSTLRSEALKGVDAFVHLVGIIVERPPRATFPRIHVQGTRNVAEAARRLGATRFLYMSAIGSAPDASAEYSRTKYAAEEIVRSSGLDYTILRPSIILGQNGEFVEQMRALVRFGGLPIPVPSPVIPVPGDGDNRFQPIFVDDLAACVSRAITDGAGRNETVAVAGKSVVTFNGLIDGFARAEGISKPKVHLPLSLLQLIAPLVEHLPQPPFTADQLANLRLDNTADVGPMLSIFGVDPFGFDEIMKRLSF